MIRVLSRASLIAVTIAVFLVGEVFAALPDFTDLADKAGGAVVNISTSKLVKQRPGGNRFQFRTPPGQQNPFEDFFEQFDKFFNQPNRPSRRQSSLGSGFIISSDGYIVTNNHVIAEADQIKVNVQGKNSKQDSYDATVVGRDQETDLAVLKIKATGLPTIEWGDSDKLKIGEWLLAIGNPFGLDHSVTAGIVSAKGRTIGAGPFDDFIQTDASINPGNSGGPLINMSGKVIGINTAIVAAGQGIGFAIPSNMAQKIIGQLKEGKKLSRGWLGVTIQDVDENTAKALGLPGPKGALISSVMAGEPAEKAGVKAGDVVIAVNGKDVENNADLLKKIAGLTPGEKPELTVIRDGEKKSIVVTLAERDPERVAKAGERGEDGGMGKEKASLGLTLAPIGKEEAKRFGLDKPQGLAVTAVEPGSPAEEARIQPGDVVLQVNNRAVNSVSEFSGIVDGEGKKRGAVTMLVKRQGRTFFVSMPVQ